MGEWESINWTSGQSVSIWCYTTAFILDSVEFAENTISCITQWPFNISEKLVHVWPRKKKKAEDLYSSSKISLSLFNGSTIDLYSGK